MKPLLTFDVKILNWLKKTGCILKFEIANRLFIMFFIFRIALEDSYGVNVMYQWLSCQLQDRFSRKCSCHCQASHRIPSPLVRRVPQDLR
jgi:hypothetical protein